MLTYCVFLLRILRFRNVRRFFLRNGFYKRHFLKLYAGQTQVLLQTPALLNALLNITTARNWSQPSIAAMRLHAYLAQGILPGSPGARWAQLPGMKRGDIRALPATSRDFADVISHLEKQKNVLAEDARKAVERWGRIEIVDARFKGMLQYYMVRPEMPSDLA
jgi:translocation protein SEC63